MIIHSAYGEKAKQKKYIPGKSLTKQSMKDETDINFIINRYQKTGSLEHLREYEGQYGDFISIDFHAAMNVITEADNMFDTLPSSIRSKFENDPGKFLDYATNPENHDGMVEMGLAYESIPDEPEETLPEPVTATPEGEKTPITT